MSLCKKINFLEWLSFSDEDVAAESLLSLNVKSIEGYDTQDIVTNM